MTWTTRFEFVDEEKHYKECPGQIGKFELDRYSNGNSFIHFSKINRT